MDTRSRFRAPCTGTGRTLLEDPSRTVGSCGPATAWASRKGGAKGEGGEVSPSWASELDPRGAEKIPKAIPCIGPYCKPTQVGESRRLRRSRELSLRN